MTDTLATGIPAEPAGSIPARRIRLLAFLAIAVFMLAGPVIEQFAGTRTVFWRSWTMFSGIGIGLVDASFSVRQPDGTSAPIDRFAVLGERRNGKLRRIETSEELTSIIERLCAALGSGADLRVKARQATRDGWRIINTGEQNACPG
ncbi:hypothetical protein [Taklimakanibacter albus]|uniref:Uncharacterized protein n=1 Tax=Taklimakanibacter albus TaxID=2800327 RepID=A0ACC5QZN1_9HYPH|nr:hypothetical protein [Aestuariivirga sp. YIM B02566]MBK1865871.1 hypothetical protein [Aestuariivirga sp. YIM B02566]